MINALPLLLGPEGYQISRSVRLRSSASAYFNRTPGSAGNRQTWTWSGWVKRGTVSPRVTLFGFGTSAASGGSGGAVYFDSNTIYVVSGGGTATFLSTTPVYRDPSAWYHIVIAFDSTQATASNRVKIYVNGLQVTAFANTTYPSQNYNSDYNNTIAQYIGVRGDGGLDSYFDGYLTEINSIDGQALTPASFGETNPVTGVWQPKKYTGTYGTNGFFLNFADNSAATAAAIGKDYSGNGNNWTPNNISVTAGATYDSMLDVPTQWADGGNGRGNYAVLNPLDRASGTFSNANLDTSINANSSASTVGTFAMTSGKWYWEITPNSASVFSAMIGIADQTVDVRGWISANAWYYYSSGQKYNAATGATYGASYAAGDIIGVAYDADAGSLSFYKNGVSQGVAYSSGLLGKTIVPAFANGTSSNAQPYSANFGQRPFTYTPPTGFKALNTLNLPTPTILKGNQYFDATLYTANASSQTISSLQFQPDFLWIKSRSGAYSNILQDSVRGATAQLFSNLTNAEFTGTDRVQSFTSNGWTMGADAAFGVNAPNGATQVAWSWKEGPTQGFDIVTYTGDGVSSRTVAHSLGVTPAMIITKARSATSEWMVAHKSLGNGNLILNQTLQSYNPATQYSQGGLAAPNSSTTFGFAAGSGGVGNSNANGVTYVAYLFSEVAGFSKAFSYTGNGSADGPFVFLGFRPRFILTKGSSTTGSWWLYDTARSTYNEMTDLLRADLSNADVTQGFCDSLSNGFKIRNTGNNTSGQTYIGFAWAESPFKFSLGR